MMDKVELRPSTYLVVVGDVAIACGVAESCQLSVWRPIVKSKVCIFYGKILSLVKHSGSFAILAIVVSEKYRII